MHPALHSVPTANDIRNLLRHGFQALQAGRMDEAAHCCRQALEARPDLPQAHFLVGLVALEGKDRKTAFQAFGSVTRLDPAHSAAWAQLARLFMSEGQVNRADAALTEAIRHEPSDPLVMDLIGTVSSLMGEYHQARHWYERAVEARPRHTPYLINLANNAVYFGDTARAMEILDAIIAIDPASPQAHWALAGARRARDRSHVDQLEALLARPRLHPRIEAFYAYGLGKEYEDLECWPEAFAAFARGAAARRQTVEYDEPMERETFAFLERHFTREWLDASPPGDPSAAPIFIVGQPRTGTTLVERIIAAHSQVHAAGELQQFSLGIRRLSEHRDPRRFTPELFQAALAVDPAALGRVYLDTTRRMQGGTPHFIDKLPQNYLCLPLMLAALPNARVVHLTREPVDACFASFKQLFADAYLHSYEQREMARHHARYRRLMDRWRERFGDRFIDVSYEGTTRDLETSARRLIDYLGLPWEDACLEFHRQSGAVSTASAAQVREPAHTRSVGRWRRYADELAPMLDTLRNEGIDIDG